jgi:hypothetical protein
MTGALLTRSLRVIAIATLCSASSPEPAGGRLFRSVRVYAQRGIRPDVQFASTDVHSWVRTRDCPQPERHGWGRIGLARVANGAVINGTEFLRPFSVPPGSPRPRLAGTLNFAAPVIELPPLDSVGPIFAEFTAPFVLNGQVTGFAAHDLDGREPLFHVALVGQADVRYTFAATPEPRTLALLGTGLVGLVARARPKRRRV